MRAPGSPDRPGRVGAPALPGRRRALRALLGPLLAAPVLAATPRGHMTGRGRTAFVYHPDYLLHDTGARHPERPARLTAILAHLRETGLMERLLRVSPAPAADRWLATVHDPAYLATLARAAADGPVWLDADTVVSPASEHVARLAVGGVLAALDAVLDGRARNAFVAARPPGHHAMAGRGMGFCLLNQVAVGVRYAQARHGVERVLVVDWDVHHGNGTQAMFDADPTVLYASVHQYPHYPGTGAADERGTGAGAGLTLNMPLSAGAGDADALAAFHRQLVPAATAFRPDLVLVSAGFDAHRADPLADLQLTARGYGDLTRVVMELAARSARGRVVSVLEGGYDLDALARSVASHLRVLASS